MKLAENSCELVVDFVFGDYIDHVVVVCGDVCCCCVYGHNGDLLVSTKFMVMCKGGMAEWRCECDFVLGDYIDHVVVVCDDVCCCCVHAFNGDILVFRKYGCVL